MPLPAEARAIQADILPACMVKRSCRHVDPDEVYGQVFEAIEEILLQCVCIKVGDDSGCCPRVLLHSFVCSVMRMAPLIKTHVNGSVEKRLYIVLNTEGFCVQDTQYFRVYHHRPLPGVFVNRLSAIVVKMVRSIDGNLNLSSEVSTPKVRVAVKSLFAFWQSMPNALLINSMQKNERPPHVVSEAVWNHPCTVNGLVITNPASLFSYKPYYQKLASFPYDAVDHPCLLKGAPKEVVSRAKVPDEDDEDEAPAPVMSMVAVKDQDAVEVIPNEGSSSASAPKVARSLTVHPEAPPLKVPRVGSCEAVGCPSPDDDLDCLKWLGDDELEIDLNKIGGECLFDPFC